MNSQKSETQEKLNTNKEKQKLSDGKPVPKSEQGRTIEKISKVAKVANVSHDTIAHPLFLQSGKNYHSAPLSTMDNEPKHLYILKCNR